MSSSDPPTRKPLRVPAGPIERATRWGVLAGGLAAGFVGEGVRRMAGGAQAGYDELVFTAANAERLVRGLGRMRGAAMKLGQALSLELDGVMPEGFTDVLASLQSSGYTMTPAQRNRVLGGAWGPGWRRNFERFDEEPFAAASIGQVHRAADKDGREVAVKVQFPGVAASIGADVDNLGTLFRATGLVPRDYDIGPLLAQVKEQLENETDYLREAASLERYAQELQHLDNVRVPAPVRGLTTGEVLTMEFVEGRPLAELWQDKAPRAVREAAAATLVRVVLCELFEAGFVQSDPNFANFLVDGDTLVCLDLGAAVEVDERTRARVRAMLAAGLAADENRLVELFREFGWVGDEADELVRPLAELVTLSCEPLRQTTPYDFGAADLHLRARDLSMDLVLRRGMRRPPPPEIVFLNRKLGGTYLICARLGARLDLGELAGAYLDG